MIEQKTGKAWIHWGLLGLSMLAATNVAWADFRVQSTGGLKVWEPGQDEYSFRLHGLLQLDETVYLGSHAARNNSFPNGSNLRRALLDLSGGMGANWSYLLEAAFLSGNGITLNNAYLNYSFGFGNVQIGDYQPYFGLENSANYEDLVFLEPGYTANTGGIASSMGVFVDVALNETFSFQGGIFQPNYALPAVDLALPLLGTSKSQRIGYAGRLAASPIVTENMTLHAGLNAYHQSLVATNTDGIPVSAGSPSLSWYSVSPEIQGRAGGEVLLSANPTTDTSATRFSFFQEYQLELAAGWGPLLVQGEYLSTYFARHWDALGGIQPQSYQVEASYVLTGESRPYDPVQKIFGRPQPHSEYGALEVAVRHSFLDMNKKNLRGGRAKGETLGINWYATDHVRLALNYTHTHLNPVNDLPSRRLNIYGMRLQAKF